MLTELQTSKMGFDFLSIGKTIKPKKEFKVGGIVVFRSTTLDLRPPTSGNDNTSINVVRGDNILLHISIRRKENAFVFNSKPAGGNWGPEERKPLKGAFNYDQTSITVYDHGDFFQVLVDYETIIYYKKRIAGNADGFSYNVDATPSPFSNPLVVSIFPSFAGIVPSGEVGSKSTADEH